MNPLPLPSAMWTRLALLMGIAVCIVAWFGLLWDFPATSLLDAPNGAGRVIALVTAFGLMLFWAIVLTHKAARAFGPTKPANLDPVLWKLVEPILLRCGFGHIPVRLAQDFEVYDALVCRRWGRRTLVLGGGARLLARRRPALLEAVVLHELGHLRGTDLAAGYLARAILFSLGCIGFLTLAAAFLPLQEKQAREDWSFLLHSQYALLAIAQTVWLLAIAYIEYAAVLRSREHYADLSAAAHGAGAPFVTHGSPERAFTQLFRHHPSDSSRARVLARPESIATYSGIEVLWLGYLVGMALDLAGVIPERLRNVMNTYSHRDWNIAQKLQSALDLIPYDLFTSICVVFFTCYAVAAVLGGILARWSFLAEFRRSPTKDVAVDLGKLAFFLASGAVIGLLLNPLILSRLSVWSTEHVTTWLFGATIQGIGIAILVLAFITVIAPIIRVFSRGIIRYCKRPPPTWLHFVIFFASTYVGMQAVQFTMMLAGFALGSVSTVDMPLEGWISSAIGGGIPVLLFIFLAVLIRFLVRKHLTQPFPDWLVWRTQRSDQIS